MEEGWLTLAEVEAFCAERGLSWHTVRRWQTEGLVPRAIKKRKVGARGGTESFFPPDTLVSIARVAEAKSHKAGLHVAAVEEWLSGRVLDLGDVRKAMLSCLGGKWLEVPSGSTPEEHAELIVDSGRRGLRETTVFQRITEKGGNVGIGVVADAYVRLLLGRRASTDDFDRKETLRLMFQALGFPKEHPVLAADDWQAYRKSLRRTFIELELGKLVSIHSQRESVLRATDDDLFRAREDLKSVQRLFELELMYEEFQRGSGLGIGHLARIMESTRVKVGVLSTLIYLRRTIDPEALDALFLKIHADADRLESAKMTLA